MTEWREIKGWPGYEVSSDGEVRLTVKRRTRGPRIIPGTKHGNYRAIATTFNGQKVLGLLHRMVCEAFHGPAPSPKHQVRHLDGNPDNNRADNLAWGTVKENAADRRLHGRDRFGSAHHNAKLDEHDIIAIFCLARRGYTGEEIGALFGLNRNTINKIVARELWASVSVPEPLFEAARARNAAHVTGRRSNGGVLDHEAAE